jgi:hypothetical protein
MLVLSLFASGSYAFGFNMGTKGEIAKGVEKMLDKRPVCLSWFSGNKEATVVMQDGGHEWKRNQRILKNYQEAGLITLGLSSFDMIRAKEVPLSSPEELPRLALKVKVGEKVMVWHATLTDAGKAAHTREGWRWEGDAYRGLCSPTAKYALDEVVRWSEPTPSEGKTITEAIFTMKMKKLDGAFAKYYEIVNVKDFEGSIKLYKTSEGWLPMGSPKYKKKETN